MRWLAVLGLAVLLLAGCGETSTIRERDVIVRGDEEMTTPPVPEATPRPGGGLRVTNIRVAVVSHGQAADGFWAVVRKGLEDAARQTGIAVSYRAPDRYDTGRMGRMIDEAIGARLDGLVVSLPEVRALRAPLARAARARIPVVSINSGSDRFRSLGVLAHVGQPEYRAGFESGVRMGEAGVRRGLCVNQEAGNEGVDARCRGFTAGLRRSGGRTEQVSIDLQDARGAQDAIGRAIRARAVDGVMSLGTAAALPALRAVTADRSGRRIRLATFDLTPEVLEAVRDGRMLFAVDQQPYLQGYTAITLLAERARHGLMPSAGELIATGPKFITAGDVTDRLIELSRQGFR